MGDEFIADLAVAMERDPDAGPLVQLGRAYLGTGEDSKALESFRHAQALDPGAADAYRLAAEALIRIALGLNRRIATRKSEGDLRPGAEAARLT